MKTAARFVLASALLATAQATTYTVKDSYDHTNFFNDDAFAFFDEADPTNGFVEYVSGTNASDSGLAGYMNNMVYLGADHRNAASSSGRRSTRISSVTGYDKGLFIADISHMPVGCGVWPAFWTFGPDWPSGGEVDIIEGVNSQATDAITLHTSSGCTMVNTGSQADSSFLSDSISLDCGADDGKTGCQIETTNTNAFGAGFNAGGGGVYVMELASEAISVWFFARNSTIANNLVIGGSASETPDTSVFGTPVARFSGCDIDSNFKQQSITFDIDFCGDWAGDADVWASDATCSAKADSCEDYVRNNSADFVDAYWMINSVRVYEASSDSSESASLTSIFGREAAAAPASRRSAHGHGHHAKRDGRVPQIFRA